jgi:hypothetical protein
VAGLGSRVVSPLALGAAGVGAHLADNDVLSRDLLIAAGAAFVANLVARGIRSAH